MRRVWQFPQPSPWLRPSQQLLQESKPSLAPHLRESVVFWCLPWISVEQNIFTHWSWHEMSAPGSMMFSMHVTRPLVEKRWFGLE